MTTDALDPATPARHAPAVWMVGNDYAWTASESLDRIAERVRIDVADVQSDGMIPTQAVFTIVADTTGAVSVLRTTINGLSLGIDPDRMGTRAAMRVVFELASHYNRVNLTQPQQVRFIHHITATHDGVAYAHLVTTMLGDGDAAIEPAAATSPAPITQEPALMR